MPYVTEMPERMELGHQETPSPLNPLGIKGAGEAGVIPVSAVLAAGGRGCRRPPASSRMPLSPDLLFGLRATMRPADPERTA